MPTRPPGFCIGCPERPIFAATKLVEQELGKHHIASDIGCHLFSIMPPFELGATTMGYGLGPASASAFNSPDAKRRSISFVGDGGFWHNGLTSSIGNAVFNKNDGVIVIVDNYYSAATGGQDILSSRASNRSKSTKHPITEAVKGMGVNWVRHIDRTYDVRHDARHAEGGADDQGNRAEGHRRLVRMHAQPAAPRSARPQARRSADGKRVVKPKFGVDEDVCTGDHACMRLSGCPSLSVKTSRRSAARRSGGRHRRELRRLRQLRRGGRCGGAVPLLLPGRRDPQSARLGPLLDRMRRRRHRLAAAAARNEAA